jgi:hypothetical protein
MNGPVMVGARPWRTFPLLCALGAITTALLMSARPAGAQGPPPVAAPQVERPIAFDAAGHVLVLTPSAAARWKLSGPEWPLGSDWSEARLYATESGAAVLVVQRVDGAVARYAYDSNALLRLRALVDAAVLAQGADIGGVRGSTTTVTSEPAGNALIRNQAVLGLVAYGPATAAILSDNGAAAAGGYLLAAGSSFFIAAKMVRDRSVTRAQTILGFHGGTRGAIAGAAVAAIGNADGGPGYGVPILVGALGGTIAGFRGARGMSDGEAASSGFGADIAALTTVGLAGAIGAFDEDTAQIDDGLPTNGKIALGSGLAAGLAGYLIGPRYARRAAYNVTAGDIDVSFTSAALGALAANTVIDNSTDARTRFAVSTGGMLIGALVADRTKVRHADRTSADGTLVQLGAIAGMLMGGGVALATESEAQATIGLVAAGGIAGLALGDVLVRPARDAGPRRGVLPNGDASARSSGSSRVSLSIAPAVAAAALALREPPRVGSARGARLARPAITRVPVMRVSF